MDGSASVGICAHNEEETIGELLEQIFSEDVAISQVIVVAAGDDDTVSIVREKQDIYPEIEVVAEGERRGQSAAQNEILDRASEELLFLIDGDGLIKEGSLKLLEERYDGSSILYGREVPDTPDTFGGDVIDYFWKLHHGLSKKTPKYTTQLALLPADLIDRIPKEIVIDDEYIGIRAREQGYGIEYVPEAEKHHNIKGDLKSFLRHRRKNWAGMIQIQLYEKRDNLQPTGQKISFYIKKLGRADLKEKFMFAVVGTLEGVALIGALYDSLRNDWPFKWKR
jgi:glycosyltransferase involved in cell wall biosynthesis